MEKGINMEMAKFVSLDRYISGGSVVFVPVDTIDERHEKPVLFEAESLIR
jgi:hypothetical protein